LAPATTAWSARLSRHGGPEGEGGGAPFRGRRRGRDGGIPPGFPQLDAAYTVSLLNPKVIRDLDLHGHGLRIVERAHMNFLPTP
jgi:hypothetical protein